MKTKSVNLPDDLPEWVWWGTLATVGIVIVITAIGAILLTNGAADPPVAGPVIVSDDNLIWAGGPVIALAVGESVWFAAPEDMRLPSEAFTLAVSARLTADSDPGAAWGVWIETAAGDRVIYAISGEGYTTTRSCGPAVFRVGNIEDCPALRPEWRWMPYPRIQPPGAVNTITLHTSTPYRKESSSKENSRGGEVRLRINREIMGAAPIAGSGRWGVWLRGGRTERASGVAGWIEWDKVEVRGTVSDWQN